MKCIIQGGRVVLAFSDTANLSNWPTVVDGGEESTVANVPEMEIVTADIPDGTSVLDLIYDGSSVSLKTLSADELAIERAGKWDAIKVERDRRLLHGGYPFGGHWYHSDLIARSQHLANARRADLVQAAGGDMDAPFLLGPYTVQIKTMDDGYMPITATIAHSIMGAAEIQELLTYGAAISHKAAVDVSTNPAAYDFSSGWPAIYVGIDG